MYTQIQTETDFAPLSMEEIIQALLDWEFEQSRSVEH